MKVFLLLATLIVSGTVSAENWLNISEEGETPYYFDRDSITSRYDPRGDLIVGMWTMQPATDPVSEHAVANQIFNQANCSNMSIKHAEMLEIDADGEVLWRLSQVKNEINLASVMPLDYYYPKPGDAYSFNLEVMCNEATIDLGFQNAGI